MKKILKWVGLSVIVVLALIQAIRPARTNPPIDETQTMQANTRMTPRISALLERACSDCHSSKTTWPWYSQIAPVSWFIVDDVNGGRKHLSLSDWGTYKSEKKATKLQEICEQIEKGEMPLPSYVRLHPTAKLSDSDKQVLCEWAKQERERVIAGQ